MDIIWPIKTNKATQGATYSVPDMIQTLAEIDFKNRSHNDAASDLMRRNGGDPTRYKNPGQIIGGVRAQIRKRVKLRDPETIRLLQAAGYQLTSAGGAVPATPTPTPTPAPTPAVAPATSAELMEMLQEHVAETTQPEEQELHEAPIDPDEVAVEPAPEPPAQASPPRVAEPDTPDGLRRRGRG